MNVEKELHKAQKYDIVSFDVFDTLIEREVKKPTEVFYWVGMACFSEHGKAVDFQQHRILAEHVARNVSYTEEVNLDDIYNALEGYDIEIVEKLKKLEIETEINLCHPRRQIVDLFNRMKHIGIPVVLISDMYLPKNCLVNMLSKCGVDGYRALFVSNEYGCNKISGSLFQVVHRKFDIKNAMHLHYGDSIKADVLGARKAKVKPRFIFRKNWFKLFMDKLYESFRSQC